MTTETVEPTSIPQEATQPPTSDTNMAEEATQEDVSVMTGRFIMSIHAGKIMLEANAFESMINTLADKVASDDSADPTSKAIVMATLKTLKLMLETTCATFLWQTGNVPKEKEEEFRRIFGGVVDGVEGEQPTKQ